jgi:hypothetical protein
MMSVLRDVVDILDLPLSIDDMEKLLESFPRLRDELDNLPAMQVPGAEAAR